MGQKFKTLDYNGLGCWTFGKLEDWNNICEHCNSLYDHVRSFGNFGGLKRNQKVDHERSHGIAVGVGKKMPWVLRNQCSTEPWNFELHTAFYHEVHIEIGRRKLQKDKSQGL